MRLGKLCPKSDAVVHRSSRSKLSALDIDKMQGNSFSAMQIVGIYWELCWKTTRKVEVYLFIQQADMLVGSRRRDDCENPAIRVDTSSQFQNQEQVILMTNPSTSSLIYPFQQFNASSAFFLLVLFMSLGSLSECIERQVSSPSRT